MNPSRLVRIDEIVVTGPGAPAIASVDDLAGQEVFVRPSSSYHESLVKLNTDLVARGRKPVGSRRASCSASVADGGRPEPGSLCRPWHTGIRQMPKGALA